MTPSEDDNLLLLDSSDRVDGTNKIFYERFPYPWRPSTFHFVTDPDLHRRLLTQNLGSFDHTRVSRAPEIWVAGCGANQAVYTALRYPESNVHGSDLSARSLDISRDRAKEFGLHNLELHQESIRNSGFLDRFDYIVCTGVIHHTADPELTLRALGRALRRGGVLELMVYNRFHRLVNVACQKAIRLLISEEPTLNCDEDIRVARTLIRTFRDKSLVYDLLQRHRDTSESELADSLIQPVEWHYTVESLTSMASACGLDILSWCPNDFDHAQGALWHCDLGNLELQHRFDKLPDLRRWQILNLLLLDRSPMLWFYLQRADSGWKRESESEINTAFLSAVFRKLHATRRTFALSASGEYRLSETQFPNGGPVPSVAAVYGAIDGRSSMKAVFARVGRPVTFASVLQARALLATSTSPFLMAEG